ncbi:hypothetical protein MT418_000639 [Batrachochytrium dendrobatidis]
MPSIVCANKGCGKPFEPSIEGNKECVYHSGSAVFHEGLKGWSCCTKRVTDFDAFLKIPGCTTGTHTDKAPEASVSVAAVSTTATDPKKSDNGVETFTMASVPAALPASIPAVTAPVFLEKDMHDPADAIVAPGTLCKRKTCGQSFLDDTSRSQECIHHPGAPVFHEGSKGWSCCTRRVLEFDEFLKIKGCSTSKHRFTNVHLESTDIKQVVECRRDWYQTPDTVILSIFAKKVDKLATTVVFDKTSLKVDILFLDGSSSQYHTDLFQPIDPNASKFEVLSTKLEIVLKKANSLSWVAIEPKENVTTWTTFGITGSVGTVGGKEAVVGHDAPLHLLPKH